MPMVESRWIRTLCSRVSKAEDMSRRTSMEPRLLFRPESKSEVMSVSTDSVDVWGRYTYGMPIGTLIDVWDFIGYKVCDKLGGDYAFKDHRVD